MRTINNPDKKFLSVIRSKRISNPFDLYGKENKNTREEILSTLEAFRTQIPGNDYLRMVEKIYLLYQKTFGVDIRTLKREERHELIKNWIKGA